MSGPRSRHAHGETVDDFETTIKVIVVGNGQVGKSSMTTRYCKGFFTDTYKKTIGVDFMEKTIEVEEHGETVKLMVWDTAGQEEFDSLTSRYYKGAGACALVFSTVDRDSFNAIETWKRKVHDECGDIPMCLVQNKIDLIDEALMTPEEVENLARRTKLKLFRACVKDNTNVSEVFDHLAAQYIIHGHHTQAVTAITDFDEGDEPKKGKGGGGGGGKTDEGGPSKRRTGSADGGRGSGGGAGGGGTFKLGEEPSGPSKRRTGGKKQKISCTIL
mmetsp:Transcript_116446/g.323667  ORF Transcript_116446/g.323667 Transcript_116446/m.323667 type:complete len:273 (-) Transcript_116446:148-966(-)